MKFNFYSTNNNKKFYKSKNITQRTAKEAGNRLMKETSIKIPVKTFV
jgi:hypothetical protein